MGPEIDKGEILSTWKEIAAYLNSGTRTCLRWEKSAGLPVHRQEGAPRSRIYAYKHELDAWFKSRLSNGTIHAEESTAVRAFWKNPYIVAPVVVFLAATAYWFFFRASAKPAPAGGVQVGSAPKSSGPGEINPGSILAAEWAAAGRIRIWKVKDDFSYQDTWRIEPVRHTTCAAGDLDGDPYIEAAAPGHCRDFAVAGG